MLFLMSTTHRIVFEDFHDVRESATMARCPQWIGLHSSLKLLPVFLYVIEQFHYSSYQSSTNFEYLLNLMNNSMK